MSIQRNTVDGLRVVLYLRQQFIEGKRNVGRQEEGAC